MALLVPSSLDRLLWLLAAACCAAAGSAAQLVGAGAPAMPYYLSALFTYRFVAPNVQTTFTGAMLGDGALCRLLNYTRECAATDVLQPLSIDYGSIVTIPTPKMYQQYPDLQLYPAFAYSVAFNYNLNGVDNLVLTIPTLAKIWSGRITTWDHPDIVASNPNFTAWRIPANQSIALVARTDGAGATPLMKKMMGAADPAFPINTVNWGGLVKPIVYSSAVGLVSYVSRTPYTMGYAAPFDSMGVIPMVKLNRSGVILECDFESVQYAVLEKGLSFGNNGDDPAHLTGDINNALNPLAWPAVLWSYVAVRKSTLRPGASCATVKALMDFWLWFWHSSDMVELGSTLGFVALPEVVKNKIVARFKRDMYCDGQPVWQETEVPVLAGYGTESASPIFDKFRQSYGVVNSSVALSYTTLASEQDDVSAVLRAGGFLVSTAPPPGAGVYSLVLGGEAVVAVSMVANLVLDGRTLARILNGDITTWLHADILALNPNGIRTGGKLLNNTAQRIVLLRGPTTASKPLTALLQQYYPAYTGAALQAAEWFPREALLWSGVIGSPFTLSVTALVGSLPVELLTASILSGGVPVAPSLATARACTSAATYNPATKAVALPPAGTAACYPLLLTLYVSLQRQCPAPPATARAATFLQWMFTKDSLTAALDALNLVSLYNVSDAIQAANDDALFQLSCEVRPVPTTPTDLVPLLLGIIIPIALVVLAGCAACGWWLWRVTENNRMMRKKFSNDNVAESCAEAIARFDLAAVQWLREVTEPNKIQLAFLAIIALLTEVKPYIPDQLLSRLTANKVDVDTAEDGDNDSDQPLRSPVSPRRQSALGSTSTSSVSHSGRGNRRGPPSFGPSVEGAQQVLAMRDWRRKRCTYLCVRFGSTHPSAERRLPEMVRVAGQVVDLAKAHGATMDAVGVDVVNVHWGVANLSPASAIRAVQVALEIAKLRDTLPEEQRAAFWLQMGVGKGPCDCGTVSSSA
eukprot:EG_transcript_2108